MTIKNIINNSRFPIVNCHFQLTRNIQNGHQNAYFEQVIKTEKIENIDKIHTNICVSFSPFKSEQVNTSKKINENK